MHPKGETSTTKNSKPTRGLWLSQNGSETSTKALSISRTRSRRSLASHPGQDKTKRQSSRRFKTSTPLSRGAVTHNARERRKVVIVRWSFRRLWPERERVWEE